MLPRFGRQKPHIATVRLKMKGCENIKQHWGKCPSAPRFLKSMPETFSKCYPEAHLRNPGIES